jgi:hypothetical protein
MHFLQNKKSYPGHQIFNSNRLMQNIPSISAYFVKCAFLPEWGSEKGSLFDDSDKFSSAVCQARGEKTRVQHPTCNKCAHCGRFGVWRPVARTCETWFQLKSRKSSTVGPNLVVHIETRRCFYISQDRAGAKSKMLFSEKNPTGVIWAEKNIAYSKIKSFKC